MTALDTDSTEGDAWDRPDVEERMIRVAGYLLHARKVTYQQDGPTVLLINGLGAHTRMWSVVESSVGAGTLISFDAPGSGLSPSPRCLLTIPVLARLAEGVLDEFRVDQADVVGYSMGGVVAQQLAIQSPARVGRLVLVTTSVGIGAVPGGLFALLNVATPLRYHLPWFYRRTIGGLAGGRARTDAEWVRAHGELRHESTPTSLGYALQVVGLVWTTLGSLRDVTHPTLVVAGGDDPLIPPPNAHLLTSLLPESRGFVLAGEGHLMLADPDSAVHELVTEFLTTPTVEESRTWQTGFAGRQGEELHELLRTPGGSWPRAAQPWSLAYAVIRRCYGVGKGGRQGE